MPFWPAGGCWKGAGNPQAPGRQAASPPQSVGVATIATGDIEVVLTGLGAVTPLATVTVKTQINGQLQSVAFTEGQMVHKGDFLAQIDPRPYQVALEQAQGTLAHDTGLLDQARADYARYQTLGRQDSISRQQVEDQQYLIKQYEGSVTADQGAVDSAKLNLTYCHIVSPVDGRIGIRLVDPGNYVQTSDTNGLFVVTQLQPMSVLFTLPEDDVDQVRTQMAKGTLPVQAYDRANARQVAAGTLATIDNQIDSTTGTVKLRAMFPNTDNALFPQQFVNAHLLVQTLKGVVVAPQAAVQQGRAGRLSSISSSRTTRSRVQVVKTGAAAGRQGADHRRPEGRGQGGGRRSRPAARRRQDHDCPAARPGPGPRNGPRRPRQSRKRRSPRRHPGAQRYPGTCRCARRCARHCPRPGGCPCPARRARRRMSPSRSSSSARSGRRC